MVYLLCFTKKRNVLKKRNAFLIVVFFFYIVLGYAQKKEIVIQLNNHFKQDINTNYLIALKNATKAVDLSEELNIKKLLLASYTNLSEILFATHNYTNSEKFITKALPIATSLKDFQKLSVLYNRLGSLQKKRNEYKKALYSYEKALKLAQANHLQKEICDIQTNLALLFWVTGDVKSAKSKLLSNILSAKKIKYNRGLAYIYNGLGVFLLQKNKDSSLYYYKKSYLLADSIEQKRIKAIASVNLGDLLLSKKEFNTSLKYLLEAERINKELGNKSSLHYINISLGIYYEYLDDFKKAIEKYETAINEYGQYVDDSQKMKAFWIVSGVYYHSGDYKQAYLYQEKYTLLKDSLFNIEKSKEFDKIKTQYEVEKKNNQIALLEKDNELETNRKKTIFISSILLLIPLLLLLFFYKHRIKTQQRIREKEQLLYEKEKEKLEQQQEIKRIEGQIEGEEREKNRIAKELHDGVGGQLAGIQHYLGSLNSNEKIEHLKKNILTVTKEVRILSHNLSSHYSSNQPLEVLLTELKMQYESNDKLQVNITVFPPDCFNGLRSTLKHSIYRILQELLHNVYKHAKATQVDLSFTRHQNTLILIVEDNGIGFNTNKHKKGIGLQNIKERIESLDGKFIIDSTLKKGTHITLEIPI